jgi:hypothetical protein
MLNSHLLKQPFSANLPQVYFSFQVKIDKK